MKHTGLFNKYSVMNFTPFTMSSNAGASVSTKLVSHCVLSKVLPVGNLNCFTEYLLYSVTGPGYSMHILTTAPTLWSRTRLGTSLGRGSEEIKILSPMSVINGVKNL